ncbi:unnamed protein product [marine sediment metagenome]|uniref:Uncharacterized protein n=1 Tax=marine sediment metagenome TaxID=412755 RepID=X1RHG8_9ZZZZ
MKLVSSLYSMARFANLISKILRPSKIPAYMVNRQIGKHGARGLYIKGKGRKR